MSINHHYTLRRMKHLYFIGNGFDLHHGFNTRYTDFRNWLKDFDKIAYDNLIWLYGVSDDNSDETYNWWSRFEEHLVDFDVYDDVVEIASENSIDYGADDFHEGDRYSGGIEAEQKFEDTMTKILGYFGTWVNSLGDLLSDTEVDLDKEAVFINFNYTLTLEKLYKIPSVRVYHFHGMLGDNVYILGHGRSYQEIEKSIRDNEPQPPKDLPEEDLHDWYANQWDEAYENTVGYTASKLASYRKNTGEVINANAALFASMADLEEIIVFGCSFSEIDTPYFSEAINRAKEKSKLKFIVNWHSQKDLDNISKFFVSEGIADDKIEKKKLDEITRNK